MKSSTLLLCAAACLALVPVSLHAGDPDKKAAKKAMKAILSEYDKNGNGVIDGDEVDAVKKAYAADPNGELKRFDTNADGKLDDTEIAAIHAGKGKGKKKSKTLSPTPATTTTTPAPTSN
jgi:Ca2+-binding EF-hand superfamily protein